MRRLLLWMLLPCFVVSVLVATVVVQLQVVRRVSTIKGQRTLLRVSQSSHQIIQTHICVQAITRATPTVLRILFLAYPIVTNVAFEAFSCYEFESAGSWLIADTSIECGTDEHSQARGLAWVAIIFYPIGLLLLNAALLYLAREAIEVGPRTELSRALAFLHSEYKPHLLCAAKSPSPSRWVLPP